MFQKVKQGARYCASKALICHVWQMLVGAAQKPVGKALQLDYFWAKIIYGKHD
jgi:hypothetical protein